jgi:hypothetical protein
MMGAIFIVVMGVIVFPILANGQANPTEGNKSAHPQQELEMFRDARK